MAPYNVSWQKWQAEEQTFFHFSSTQFGVHVCKGGSSPLHRILFQQRPCHRWRGHHRSAICLLFQRALPSVQLHSCVQVETMCTDAQGMDLLQGMRAECCTHMDVLCSLSSAVLESPYSTRTHLQCGLIAVMLLMMYTEPCSSVPGPPLISGGTASVQACHLMPSTAILV